jgi:hypothetical protein
MRHAHTPAENFMLADAFLDVVEGLMTLEEANAYLCAHYPHHPSPSSVSTYLGTARRCYETIQVDGRNGRRRRGPVTAKSGYSRDLEFEMRLAVDQRAGD